MKIFIGWVHPYFLSLIAYLFLSLPAFAQSDSLSTTQLDEVTVNAFESRRNILETTASVGVVSPRTLERYATTTFTNAVNSVPGVRMEERSPGSYRFSVRGSLLRSPFGVRNVKFYWNGIPLTDANGNTPLNSLDYGSVSRMEIIKGPGSSVYGAGTGGVVLLSTAAPLGENKVEQALGVGSYGYQSRNTEVSIGDVSVRYGHQQQEGYRRQSNMVRDVFQFNSTSQIGDKATLSLLGIYSDLHYQTPGGINLAQYQKDPTQARQPTATLPGSETQNAGIYSKYSLFGIQHKLALSGHWDQSLSLYTTTNDFDNPFITNYEKRNELGFGGRNIWVFSGDVGNLNLQWTSGFEWQYGKSTQRNYNNDKGVPNGFQTSEDIRSNALTAFTQAEIKLFRSLTLNAGASFNANRFGYERFFPTPYTKEQRKFDNIISPRVAINQALGQKWSLTASLSSGYSPPTLQEVRPSAGGFRNELQPEFGFNREVSLRRVGDRLRLDVTAYQFSLKETIVRRSDEQGAEFFINAGRTDQKGIEWRVDYTLLKNAGILRDVKIWNAGTATSYRFRNYQQGQDELGGNRLPGVPAFSQNSGLDIFLVGGVAAFVTYQHVGSIFLNDANSVEAPGFDQFMLRLNWNKNWNKHFYSELSASAELVSADIYSMGYDLNAFGGRYYNAAPKQTQWLGLKAGWRW
ncbi:TonB-dependent receptor [Persicitalea jodogahamensis]|uniref:TonB-dependent receptor n=1 Tax=Persicitalea jodogahamensis TaxID=402147 RepID=A0A8J3GBH8_9BACT|nr:TonB-dependent receptor [Persicitalea jodogahamensis]GHB81724.1 TonB-dependent receptor [Persicitalea jodogahamensis]